MLKMYINFLDTNFTIFNFSKSYFHRKSNVSKDIIKKLKNVIWNSGWPKHEDLEGMGHYLWLIRAPRQTFLSSFKTLILFAKYNNLFTGLYLPYIFLSFQHRISVHTTSNAVARIPAATYSVLSIKSPSKSRAAFRIPVTQVNNRKSDR